MPYVRGYRYFWNYTLLKNICLFIGSTKIKRDINSIRCFSYSSYHPSSGIFVYYCDVLEAVVRHFCLGITFKTIFLALQCREALFPNFANTTRLWRIGSRILDHLDQSETENCLRWWKIVAGEPLRASTLFSTTVGKSRCIHFWVMISRKTHVESWTRSRDFEKISRVQADIKWVFSNWFY